MHKQLIISQGRRRKDEAGQVLMSFAVIFALLLFYLAGFVFNLAVVDAKYAQLERASYAAALAGASAVDTNTFLATGKVVLDNTTVQSRCKSSQVKSEFPTGSTFTCTISALNNSEVDVVAHDTIEMPLGVLQQSVSVTYQISAFAQNGCAQGGKC